MSRFPAFPPEYRRRWIDAGLWLDHTLADSFDETIAEAPDKVAIVCGDRRITFAAWKEAADDLAAGLVSSGLGFEDVVTVQLPNWPEMCFLQVALARIGAVIQPMHVVYREREMESLLRFCESAAIFLPASFGGFAHREAIHEMRERLPDLRLAVVCGVSDGVALPTLAEITREGRGQRALLERHLREHPVTADQPFYLNFTSGTEGTPKGFLHTPNSLLSMLERFAEMQARYDKRAKETVTLANSPMTHSFGHLATHGVIFGRSTMVLVEKFDAGEVLRIIARERVTSMSGTPAHFIALLEHPDFANTDISSVRSVGVGGARCPEKLMADIERTFGVRIGNTYGMGENIVHTRTLPNDPPEIVRTTVGKPVPGAEVAIFGEDRATPLAVGETGEIAYRGPSLFLGYFKSPEQTAATRNAEGWFFTGDVGFVDADGYLHLAGRKKELINRGGVKIFPKEIEELLLRHPQVAQAAVVGMPDYRLGERICAYVVPKPGAQPTLEEITSFLDGLGMTKKLFPERLELVAELPMTPTGKVKKIDLEADIRRKVEGESRS